MVVVEGLERESAEVSAAADFIVGWVRWDWPMMCDKEGVHPTRLTLPLKFKLPN